MTFASNILFDKLWGYWQNNNGGGARCAAKNGKIKSEELEPGARDCPNRLLALAMTYAILLHQQISLKFELVLKWTN